MAGELREILVNAKAQPSLEAEKSKGFLEAAWEGLKETKQALAPALTWGDIFSDGKSELKQQLAAGTHELAAVLFNGSGFVMYPRTAGNETPSVEDSQHALPEKTQQPEQERSQGRSM